MAVQAQVTATPPSYLKLGQRVQRAVNTPRARMSQSVILERQDDESAEDWEAMLEKPSTHGNVTITRFDDVWRMSSMIADSDLARRTTKVSRATC